MSSDFAVQTAVVELPAGVELLSLDVFDTLLLRACAEPDDVFLAVAREARRQGLLPYGVSDHDFKVIRRQAALRAEVRLRQVHPEWEERSLDEIYVGFPSRFQRSDALAAIEVEQERCHCWLNPEIAALAGLCFTHGVPVVLLSDTWYSESQLRLLLAFVGFPVDRISGVYSSADYRLTKTGGRLFQRMLADFPHVSSSAVLHIGDNEKGDVTTPRSLGYRAYRYSPPPDVDMLLQWERLRYGSVLPQIRSLRRIATQEAVAMAGRERIGFIIGASIFGPVLAGFARWVVDLCCEEGRTHVLGVMREGGLLARAVAAEAQFRGVELEVRPLFVSRHSTFFAGVQSVDRPMLEGLFLRHGLTVSELFSLFGLDDELGEFARWSEVELVEAHKVPYGDGRDLSGVLIGRLLEPLFAVRIEAWSAKQRQLFESYMAETIGNANRVVTVDVGYRGTIQRVLDRYLDGAAHLLMMGERATGTALGDGVDLRGFLGNAGEGPEAGRVAAIVRCATVIEQLLCGEEGTTLGYRSNAEGVVIPVRAKNETPEGDRRMRSAFEKGVAVFLDLWQGFGRRFPDYQREVAYDRGGLSRLLHRLIDFPTLIEAEALGEMTFDFNFGSARVRKICGKDDQLQLQSMGPDSFFRYALFEEGPAKIPWPQGTLTLQDPGWLLSRYATDSWEGGYLAAMTRFAAKLRGASVERLAIYGAGEVGTAFLRVAPFNGLKVDAVVDGNTALHGTTLAGVPVMGVEEACLKGVRTFAVTSFAYTGQIISRIREASSSLDKVRIFCPTTAQ